MENYDLVEINIKKRSFLLGVCLTILIMTLFFYVVLAPRYQKRLEKLIVEKGQVQLPIKEKSLLPQVTLPKCPTCMSEHETYNEFYSMQVEGAAWLKFSSNQVGISFEYPIEANKLVLFEYNFWPKNDSDPSGTAFGWYTRELEAEYGSTNFAWGASSDLRIGRMGVDIYKWTQKEGSYYIHSPSGNEYKVENIFIRDVSGGAKALLYKNICFFESSTCSDIKKERVLTVNFPPNHRENIEAVNFEIPNTFTDSDINRILNSIEFI